jgi:hypothetical protein
MSCHYISAAIGALSLLLGTSYVVFFGSNHWSVSVFDCGNNTSVIYNTVAIEHIKGTFNVSASIFNYRIYDSGSLTCNEGIDNNAACTFGYDVANHACDLLFPGPYIFLWLVIFVIFAVLLVKNNAYPERCQKYFLMWMIVLQAMCALLLGIWNVVCKNAANNSLVDMGIRLVSVTLGDYYIVCGLLLCVWFAVTVFLCIRRTRERVDDEYHAINENA